MASLVSTLKRKLASIIPFAVTGLDSDVEAAEARLGLGLDEDDRSHDHHDQRPRKRQRLLSSPAPDRGVARSSTLYTPLLVKESTISLDDNKASVRKCNISISGSQNSSDQPSALLRHIPNEILSHCLSYINTSSDRFALQASCKALRDISNSEEILAGVDLGGMNSYQNHIYSSFHNNLENNVNNHVGGGEVDDNVRVDDEIIHDFFGGHSNVNPVAGGARVAAVDWTETKASETIIGGIILDSDTSVTACKKLLKFASAGNMQAIYM